ncbi:MAG: hypothetical protein M3312_01140 [Actinomycetota bacterium]|nr:hypothetical protein [Actinomycetota bacterium]
MPELEAASLVEVEFSAFADGSLAARVDVPRRALERMAATLDASVDRPYQARAVRSSGGTWTAGARTFRGEVVELELPFPVSSLEVAVAPGGDPVRLVDGEEVVPPLDPSLAQALADLDRRGRARFQSFVARADRLDDDRWQLSLEPL